MINKFREHILIIIAFLTLVSMPILWNSASANPPDLPQKAQIHVAPFRVIRIEHEGLTALAQVRYTTYDYPGNHDTAASAFPGVAKLILKRDDFTVGCTGTLLLNKTHILTAAHCLTDEFGTNILLSGMATFMVDGIEEEINIETSEVNIHPDWDGDFIRGNDIAILALFRSVDTKGYDIDRNNRDDVESTSEKIGYGLSGYGLLGFDSTNYVFGQKRDGQNKYDAVADTMLKALGLRSGRDFVRGSVLQYDFDNGVADNDAFDFFFGIPGRGLGNNEVSSAPGDSGGPTITGDVIQGVTSYGITLQFVNGDTSDITPGEIDSSFGEFSGDTRVSKYAAWVDSIIGGSSGGDSGPINCSPGQARKGNC